MIKKSLLPYCQVILLVCMFGVGCATGRQGDFQLTVLHTNDVHARLLPINEFDQTCDASESDKCFGGVARRLTKIEEIRKEKKNVLLLDGGDQFQGTLFYQKYKGNEATKIMDEMGYAAMAVGNHEFDDGPENLARFIKQVNFPVLSANIDVSSDSLLAGLIKPYTVVSVGGERIGIVGCTTEETAHISSPGSQVRFLPIEETVQRTVNDLRAQGINKIMVVSHAGFGRDLEIAHNVSGIDVIVAGHSNTYLSNTDRSAEGPYPVVMTSPEGAPVLIVSAYAYGKFLGELDIEFDESGRALSWKGEPILLDKSVPENESLKKQVAALGEPLEKMRHEVVGRLPMDLDGGSRKCRHEECSLGDVIADSILFVSKRYGAQAVLMNGGGIRTGIAKGDVTRWQVMDALPFRNEIAVFNMTGEDLWETIEFGVSESHDMLSEKAARFPQVAGLHYVWNPNAPQGSRVKSVEIRSKEGGKLEPLRRDEVYRIAVSRFMFDGGDEYDRLAQKATHVEMLSETLDDALIEYLAQPSFKLGKLGGRVKSL